MNELVVATGLYVSKDLLQKLLGSTAEYIGHEMRDAVRRNLSAIFNKAADKAGKELDTPSVVPPRVLREVIEGGAYCEDKLSQEYYAGLLASSRGGDAKDDMQVPLLELIRGLSAFQIRLHYLIYWHVSKIFRSENLNIGVGFDRHKMQIFISFEAAADGLGIRERKDWHDVVDHSLLGLETKNLIVEDYTVSGKADFITENTKGQIKEAGIIVAPSLLGAELFLRSIGVKRGTGRMIIRIDAGEDKLASSTTGIRRIWQGSEPLDENLFK
jgi:hypothetical protein